MLLPKQMAIPEVAQSRECLYIDMKQVCGGCRGDECTTAVIMSASNARL